jgi:holliday junction DNA helicase RuvA
MISRLKGVLIEKSPPSIVIDCHGVGYECEVPMSTFYQLPALGENISVLTSLIVREDAHLLFGFLTEQERATFKQLLKVSGIGAKSALAILSGLSVQDLMSAISAQDTALLTRVPGIGKKTAERLLLELKDKFGLISTTQDSVSTTPAMNDIIHALLALGYPDKQVLAVIKQLPQEIGVSEGIKLALKYLSK